MRDLESVVVDIDEYRVTRKYVSHTESAATSGRRAFLFPNFYCGRPVTFSLGTSSLILIIRNFRLTECGDTTE